MNSDEEDEKKLFVKFCSRAVLFSMRKATHEQKYQRKNVENIYMQKDRLRPAIGAENFIYLFETRTGSKIYNKFVANAFLPEKKKRRTNSFGQTNETGLFRTKRTSASSTNAISTKLKTKKKKEKRSRIQLILKVKSIKNTLERRTDVFVGLRVVVRNGASAIRFQRL